MIAAIYFGVIIRLALPQNIKAKEVLINVDDNLANNLEMHFAYFHQEGRKFEDVKGISLEVISEIEKYFLMDG